MKTSFLILLTVFTTSQLFSQEISNAIATKNEIKLNTLYLPGGHLELSYERAISKKSAFGLSLGVSLAADELGYVNEILSYDYAALLYYRRYFSRRGATGFFLEADNIVSSREPYDETENEIGIGFGLALGVKFEFRKSWSFELVAGGGIFNQANQNLDEEILGSVGYDYGVNLPDTFPRLGVTIGKRF